MGIFGNIKKIFKKKEEIKNNGGFYSKDVWSETGMSYFKDKLHKNEMVYYEIVGYIPGTQSFIQKGYTYGCEEGKCEVYIYRITRDNIDLSWEAVKERCIELGVKHVPEADLDGFTHKYFAVSIPTEDCIKERYLELDEPLQPNMPSEGIVCRVEGLYPQFFKAKSFRFLTIETQNLDNEVIDIEQQENVEENA